MKTALVLILAGLGLAAPAVAQDDPPALSIRPFVMATEQSFAAKETFQAAFAGTAWTRCDSWYRTPEGRIVANWPGYMRDYFERTRTFDPGGKARYARNARRKVSCERSSASLPRAVIRSR